MNTLFWSEDHLRSLSGTAIITDKSSVSYSDLNDLVNSYQVILENRNLKGIT